MSTFKRGRLALAAVSAGAAAGVGLIAPVANAAGNTLTVDNTNPAACSDTAASAKFCTVAAAEINAGGGATINVTGTFTGPIAVTKAITLHGVNATVSGGSNGFTLDGVSGVTIDNFTVQNTVGAGFLLGDHHGGTSHPVTSGLTISNNTVTGSGGGVPGTAGVVAQPGFDMDYVTGSTFVGNTSDDNNNFGFYFSNGSNGNKILRNEASYNAQPGATVRVANGIDILTSGNTVDGNIVHNNQDSGLQFYTGAANNTVMNNVSYNNGDHGIDNLNVNGGTIVNNTVYDNCTAGINVEGTSTGFTVENNIAMNNGTAGGPQCVHGPGVPGTGGQPGQIRIADSALGNTIEGYNLVDNNVNNVLLGSKAQALAATDFQNMDPGFINIANNNFGITPGSAAVGKANPLTQSALDILGKARLLPPAGVGSIGAYEGGSASATPVAYAVVSQTGVAPTTDVVSVDASGSWPGINGPLTYSTDFGDSTASTTGSNVNVVAGPKPSHTYANEGTYTVAVTATDAATPSHSNTHDYKVIVTAKQVVPVLTLTPATGTAPIDVVADGKTSVAGKYPVASYVFDFGDNTPTQTAVAPGATSVSHHYTNAGTYTVTMTAIDTAGSPVNTQQQIILAGPPIPIPTPVTGSTGGPVLNQIGGSDRYQTGILVSQHRWTPGQANAVVIATGRTFADALSGVPLAAKLGGPLLLVDGNTSLVDPGVLAEITRVLKPGGSVVILGGTGAVSQGIANELAGVHPVTRYAGANRYETSVRIAQDGLGSPAHAVVATGNGFADALASGPFATGPFADGPGAPAAILLSNDRTLDPQVANYLAGKSPANIATIGHQAGYAVPQAATQLAGNDRYGTDLSVAQTFTGAVAGNQVGIADGMNFPDALTGGAYMASLASPGPIVLVDGITKAVPAQAYGILGGRTQNVEGDIFGGPSVITATMALEIQGALMASMVAHIGF